MIFGTGLNPLHSVCPGCVHKTVGFETLIPPPPKWLLWILLALLTFLLGWFYGRRTAPPVVQTVKVVDTLKVRDTVYMSAWASLGAYRCDSVRFEGKGVFGYGGLLQKGTGVQVAASEWPRWTVWGGVGYWTNTGIRPYLGLWWWWRPYLGLGVYAVPTRPYAVGVGAALRF